MARSIHIRIGFAAAIALLAVVAGGILVLRPGEPSDADTDAAARQRTGASDGRSTAQPAIEAGGGPSSLPVERTDALAEEWNDATHDVLGPVVEGTIVVTDEDGAKHAEEDGAFLPDFFDGVDADPDGDGVAEPAHPPRRVAVKQGRFRFDARGATVMLAADVELGGRAAVVDKGIDLASGAPLKIEARWIDDVLLHVVDEKTRRELSGITLCVGRAAEAQVEHPGIPGLLSVVVEEQSSPFHLLRATPIDRAFINGPVWVGARGHAWKCETIDFLRERSHEVALGPAGALAVVVTEPADATPLDRRARPRVRLRHVEGGAGAPICDVAAEAGELLLEGLAPGDVIAAIEIGDSYMTPLVISRAEASIRAGETARVTLSLDAVLAPKPTRLAGTAFVPPAWGSVEMVIELTPLNLRGGTHDDVRRTTRIAPDSIPGRPGWHFWSISPILPATYQLRIERAGFATLVDVGEKGLEDETLTLPEPAILHVRVVHAETQEDVTPYELGWLFTDSGNPSIAPLRRDHPSGPCIGAVRAGRGKVLALSRNSAAPLLIGTEDSELEFDVQPGPNEIVVRAEPQCGVDLVASIGSKLDESITIQWSRPDDNPLGFARGSVVVGNGRVRVRLPGPGLYRFTRSRRGEAREEPLFEVDVRKGEFVEKTITLSR